MVIRAIGCGIKFVTFLKRDLEMKEFADIQNYTCFRGKHTNPGPQVEENASSLRSRLVDNVR